LEGRINLKPPGKSDQICGIATLSPLDMVTPFSPIPAYNGFTGSYLKNPHESDKEALSIEKDPPS